MDLLVLMRAAPAIERVLARAVLGDILEDPPHRFRLSFSTAAGPSRTLAVSLHPESPWAGWPSARSSRGRGRPSVFAAAVARSLRGAVVTSVRHVKPDRVIDIAFADGHRLVLELARHGANLILVDASGRNVAAASRPRGSAERHRIGEPWIPPPLPSGRLVALGADPETIDRLVADGRTAGESGTDSLRRRLFGIGPAAAELVERECAATGRSAGEVLCRRLVDLERGAADPVVEAPADPLETAEAGALDPRTSRLFPWTPTTPAPGLRFFSGADAAGTAGLHHEAIELADDLRSRGRTLRAILERAARRAFEAEHRALEDLSAFEEPERYRRWAEALLAGLPRARREGDVALVPDPYDPDGPSIEVPAEAGRPLPAAADELFRRYRRSKRGLEGASHRAEEMRRRRDRLESLLHEQADARSETEIEGLAAAMRGEGIAVGLAPATRRGREEARRRPVRLEGVRIGRSPDGAEILIGKTGRDNDRLTFKLAAPDDFWLHAAESVGAHVVLRNPERAPRPSAEALGAAAAAAAWFSDAKGQAAAEVRWTRRKNVRRVRGAPPGTVVLKRFETIRVRPAAPREEGG